MRRLRWLFALLIPAIVWTQDRVDQGLGTIRARDEVLYLWSDDHVKRVAPGFEGLMADIYWLRTVQYFGGQRVFAREKDFDLLEPLIRITIGLDSRFEMAYRYGAIFLCEGGHAGASRPEAGVALLQEAVDKWPERWRLRQELGFYTYLFLGDHRRAAEILLEAAQISGAPYWLESMAGGFLVKGGERETARSIWRDMYARAEAGIMKDNAELNLQRLDALDMLEALEARIEAFRERVGRNPRELGELVTVGLLRGVPTDPTGVDYYYEPATGRVKIAATSFIWKAE